MAAIAEVGAGPVDKPVNENEPVKIYFGIFFDGTNNHRLQVMIGKMYREKHGFTNTLSDDEKEIIKDFTLDVDYVQDNDKIEEKRQYLEKKRENLEKILKKTNNPKLKNDIEKAIKGVDIEHSFSSLKISLKNLDELFQYDWQKGKQQDVQVNDFSNIALLEPFYQAKEKDKLGKNEYAYRIYVTGSGTNRDITKGEDTRGLAFGQGETGVLQKVLDAFNAIRSKLSLIKNANSITLNFDVFGFSRGATEARNFCYVLYKNKDKKNLSAIFNNDKVSEYKVPFLGIYDTVASVGVQEKLDVKQIRDSVVNLVGGAIDNYIIQKKKEEKKEKQKKFSLKHKISGWILNVIGSKKDNEWELYVKNHSAVHQSNVKDLGLYATTKNENVDKVLHICAADEYRENFALVDIKSSLEAGNGVEIFIPGAHADVGGGYSDDCTEIKLEKPPMYYEPNTSKYLLLQGEFLFKPSFPQESNTQSNDNTHCAQTCLRKLGWIDNGRGGKKKLIEEDEKIIRFYSGAKKGYSYIGLHLMSSYANSKSGRTMFGQNLEPDAGGNNTEKGKVRFNIPDELGGYYKNIKTMLNDKVSGRIGIEETDPDKKNCELSYSQVRNQYLHFSSNYLRSKFLWVGAAHVNTPNLYEFDEKNEGYTYRRIIYHGKQNGSTNMTEGHVEDTVFLGDKETIVDKINEHNENLQRARYDYALDKANQVGGGLK